MGLVSRLSGANPSDSGSLLVAHTLLNHDGFQQEGFWDVGRTYGLASVFSLLLIFLNSPGWWSLLSSEFLLRTSCCKITHVSAYCLAWTGLEVLVTVSPNSSLLENSKFGIFYLFFFFFSFFTPPLHLPCTSSSFSFFFSPNHHKCEHTHTHTHIHTHTQPPQAQSLCLGIQ